MSIYVEGVCTIEQKNCMSNKMTSLFFVFTIRISFVHLSHLF